AELIIALLFLFQARRDPASMATNQSIVKASLTGSIIGNILLVLGASLLAGGLRYPKQEFNATAARTGATMLTLAAISLVVPAGFAFIKGPQTFHHVDEVSVAICVLLLLIYALSLLFSLRTHKHLFLGEVGEEAAHLEA